MNLSCLKILNAVSSALIGLNQGFFLALIMVQWTWLELRVNIGLLILLGLFIGLMYGLMKSVQRPILWGGASVTLLLSSGLMISRGKLESMQILMGSVFREGILISSLSLNVATFLIVGIIVLTMLISLGLGCLRRTCSK